MKRDLTGGRTKRAPPDLLLVAGTSLRVPGTKRIVKEFSKAARSGVGGGDSHESTPSGSSSNRTSPNSSESDDRPIRTIYLNLDFPVPAREWESIFDVWVQGDIQEFVGKVRQAIQQQDEVKRAREASRQAGEKRKREVEEQEEGGNLNSAMAASSISAIKRKRIAPGAVIEQGGADQQHRHAAHSSSPTFRVHRNHVGVGPQDVFGPVVLPGLPTNGLSSRSMPEVHASVSCGIERPVVMGYRPYPLGNMREGPIGISEGHGYRHGHSKTDSSVAISINSLIN